MSNCKWNESIKWDVWTNKKHKIHTSAAFWYPKIKLKIHWICSDKGTSMVVGEKERGVNTVSHITFNSFTFNSSFPALISNTVLWPNLETQYRFFSILLKTIAQICQIHKRQTSNRIIESYKNSASSKWSFNNGNTLLFHINCTQTQKHFWNLLLAPRL